MLLKHFCSFLVHSALLSAGSDDGKVLRRQLSEPTKHLRVCTLNLENFAQEVVPTGVLTPAEVNLVCLSLGTLEKQTGLVDVCNKTEPRTSRYKISEVDFTTHTKTSDRQEASFAILTKECGIQILPMVFKAKDNICPEVPKGLRYQCDCTIQISRITDYFYNTSTETPVTVQFSQMVEYEKDFAIPVTSNRDIVTLLPNNKYIITVTFTQYHMMYLSNQGYSYRHSSYADEHVSLSFQSSYDYPKYLCYSPIKTFLYKPVPVK